MRTTKVQVLVLSLLFPAATAWSAVDLPWLDNEIYKVWLDLRTRAEFADIKGFRDSQAYTIRTRLGIGSKPYHGFSAFAEGELVWALDDDEYFDGASTNRRRRSLIADPEDVSLNRAWAQFSKAEWWDVQAKGGRQRIVLDDARFIGNVGWRQNEQTYDSALGSTSLGVEGLTLQYAYVFDVRRIFGDQGPAASRDFGSDSHLARVSYAGLDFLEITGFVYLLDFREDSPGNSSNSYGARLSGRADATDELYFRYAASYAFQTDAAENRADYEAHYVRADAGVGLKSIGWVEVGYELLGSDRGRARFVTPLATAHAFNGFADAFLDNGGVQGLQDVMLTVSPKLPWELKGKLVYHEFFSDHNANRLGWELDTVLSRPINEYLAALTKFAWYDGETRGPRDRWRFWLQLTLSY